MNLLMVIVAVGGAIGIILIVLTVRSKDFLGVARVAGLVFVLVFAVLVVAALDNQGVKAQHLLQIHSLGRQVYLQAPDKSADQWIEDFDLALQEIPDPSLKQLNEGSLVTTLNSVPGFLEGLSERRAWRQAKRQAIRIVCQAKIEDPQLVQVELLEILYWNTAMAGQVSLPTPTPTPAICVGSYRGYTYEAPEGESGWTTEDGEPFTVICSPDGDKSGTVITPTPVPAPAMTIPTPAPEPISPTPAFRSEKENESIWLWEPSWWPSQLPDGSLAVIVAIAVLSTVALSIIAIAFFKGWVQ